MNQYREGKVKSTPNRGMKKTLKPYAYKLWEPFCGVTACLLHNEPTSYSSPARLRISDPESKRKRVLIGRIVGGGRRETLRSTHDQDEGKVELTGGPHQFPLKRIWMSCG